MNNVPQNRRGEWLLQVMRFDDDPQGDNQLSTTVYETPLTIVEPDADGEPSA